MDSSLELTNTQVMLTNGQVRLALSYHTDSNHNYIVEFQDELQGGICTHWQPLPNAPHNYGIVFTTNSLPQRYYRLRRIDQPRAQLFALLANDTGTNEHDGLTYDVSVSGLALEFPEGSVLKACIDNTNGTWLTVTNLGFPRYFQIGSNKLAEIGGGILADGPHDLYLAAAEPNAAGPPIPRFVLHFFLDTTPPRLSLELARAYDSAPLNDHKTIFNPVVMSGQTDPGLTVEMLPNGLKTVADTNGFFLFTNVVLAMGENQFVVHALDAACNETFSSSAVTWYGPNCTFPDSLAGWNANVTAPSSLASNSTPVSGTVVATNCEAVMTEGDSFLVTLSRSMQVPSAPSTLSFTYIQLSFDVTASRAIKDAFEVALLNDQGSPTTYAIAGDRDAFLNASDGQSIALADGVSMIGNRVVLQLDPSALGRTATLVFRLINNDRDARTTVRISDVKFDAVQTVPFRPAGKQPGQGGVLQKRLGNAPARPVIAKSPKSPSPKAPTPLAVDLPNGSIGFVTPGLIVYTNKTEFLGSNCATSATGPLPELGNSSYQSIKIGSVTFSNVTGPGIQIGASNNPGVPSGDWSARLPGPEIALGNEYLDALFDTPVFSAGFDFVEPFNDASGSPFETTFTVTLKNQGTVVGSYLFNAPNDTAAFLGVSSTVAFDKLEIRETFTDPSDGDEYFGQFYTGKRCRPQSDEINFEKLAEVSSSLEGDFGHTSWKEQTKTLFSEVRMRNTGQYLVNVPLLVGIVRLSDPGVRVLNTDGVTPDGIPFYDLSGQVSKGSLGPGEMTGFRALAFSNPKRVQFAFDLVVLGQLNQDPTITSIPVIEAVVGRTYAYSLTATDPDSDILSFAVVTGPAGMILTNIAAAAGDQSLLTSAATVRWTPTTNDLGSHSITLRVEDGHGGFAEQHYTLSVIAPPPNRPPYFVSIPVVAARAGRAPTVTRLGFDDLTPFTKITNQYQAYGVLFTNIGDTAGDVINFVREDDGVLDFGTSVSNAIAIGYIGNETTITFVKPGTTQPATTDYAQVRVGDGDPSGETFDVSFFGTSGELFSRQEFTTGAGATNGGQTAFLSAAGIAKVTVRSRGGQSGCAFDDLVFYELNFVLSYIYDTEAVDPDGDALSYSLTQFPTNMVIDPSTGVIRWSPSTTQIGNHNVTVLVSDGRGGIATQSYVVTVLADAANHPPIIVSLAVTNVMAANPYVYDVAALDPDNDPLTFTILNGPGGMDINSSNGVIAWEVPTNFFALSTFTDGVFSINDWAQYNISDSAGTNTQSFLSVTQSATGGIPNEYRSFVQQSGKSGPATFVHIHQVETYDPGVKGAISKLRYSFHVNVTQSLQASPEPFVPAIADVNGDGISDLLVANAGGTMSVFLGTGAGQFSSKRDFPTRTGSGELLIGDLNNDGIFDVVTVSCRGYGGGDDLTVLLGLGNGAFGPPEIHDVGYCALAARLVDMDGDGNLDVVVTGVRVSVFLGNGDGGFKPQLDYITGPNPTGLIIGDVNEDGHPDVITGNAGDNRNRTASVLLGSATGALSPPIDLATGENPRALALGDVNHDGHLDLVTGNFGAGDGTAVSVLLGDGNGNFVHFLEYAVGKAPIRVFLKDLNSDSNLDLVVDNYSDSNNVSVLLGNGDGTFASRSDYAIGASSPASLALEDFNGDGIPDLVVPSRGNNVLFLLFGKGDGTFEQPKATIQPLLVQNNSYYLARGIVAASNSWSHFDSGNLTPQNFVRVYGSGPALPDFSSLGDPMQFGFASVITNPTLSASAGVDNWSVATTPSSQVDVGIRVDDGRGGFDTQSFVINVAPPGKGEIHGTVFNDLNGDGIKAGEMLFNGDFSCLQSAFRSEYIFVRRDVQADTTFTFTTNPATNHPLAASFGDHTSGTGAMMMINGSSVPNVLVWEQATRVATNSDFVFSAWVATWYPGNPATLRFEINGQQIGADFGAPAAVGQWVRFSANWNSGTNTAAIVTIVDLGLAGSGNDFALDDISLSNGNESETPLPGWIVYLDLNGNNQRNPEEPFRVTDDCGAYSFANFAPGAYIVANEGQNGWLQTAPRLGGYAITLTNAQIVTGLDFGTRQGTNPTSNAAPFFITAAPTSANVGQLFRYDAVAIDADGDSLLFALPLAPNGMAVQPTSGVVVWVPTSAQVGPQSVTLRVRDGRGGLALQTFTVTVRAANHTPEITSLPRGPAVVGRPWQYGLRAQDADGDPLTFTLGDHPPGMTLATNSGLVTWTPAAGDVGFQHVAISATDGQDTTTQFFDLPVVADSTNHSPQITSFPRASVRLGDTFLVLVESFDPDSDALIIRLTNNPPGMTLTNSLVQWIPTQLGSNYYELVVSDGQASVTYGYRLFVVSQLVNHPPNITSIPLQLAIVGETFAYDSKAVDPDNDPLDWSLVSAPSGMSIDSSLGTVRWNPTLAQLGSNFVQVRVADAQGGFSTQTFPVYVRAVNSPPSIVSVPPTKASTNHLYTYFVSADDPDGDVLTFSVTNSPLGMTINVTNGVVLWTPTPGQLGTNNVEIRVQDSHGAVASQTFSVVVTTNGNGYPVIISEALRFAVVNQLYQYQLTATDPDGDPLTFAPLSVPPGMTVDTNSGLVQWTPAQKGNYPASFGAVDPEGAGGSQSFTISVLDSNRPPVLVSPPPTNFTWATLPYAFEVTFRDPDGDSVALSVSGPPGMTIDNSGHGTWLPGITDGGTHSFTVFASDNRGGTNSAQFYLQVGVDTTPPFVVIGCPAGPLPVGSILEINAHPSDNFGPPALEVTVDGAPVALNVLFRGEVVLSRAGQIPVIARATDFFGNSSTSFCTVVVFDRNDPSLPFVEILSPEGGDIVASPTDVIGTVASTNLESFSLAVRPTDGDTFIPMVRGSNVVLTNILGVLDPSILANGDYVLQLVATNRDGGWSSVETTFTVAGELKVGNFRLSFVDLSIPVNGIPVTVARGYDTLQTQTRGDFGWGWRLEFRDTHLRTSLPPRSQDEIESGFYQRFTDYTRVAVTLPGGRREVFTFSPAPISGFAAFARLYKPAFEPFRGSTARLSVPAGPRIVIRQNQLGGWDAATDGGLGSLPYNPDDPALGGVYFLQTRDGLGYEIEPDTGLLRRATDANGNSLDFSQNGITNISSGLGVSFFRNPRGLITAVTDPMGRQVRYDYDLNDNLIAVTDRDTNTTRFIYSTNRSHFLVQVIDPLGRAGVRVNYDEQERMTNLVDAANNSVQLIHDVEHSVETVIDALGHTNSFVYDDFGNVLLEKNALGGITRREYDDNFFMTMEVDPLGHTNLFRSDDQGNVLEHTDPLGNRTQNIYTDIKGGFFAIRNGLPPYTRRLTATIDPLGSTTRNGYDSLGNLADTTDALGHTTSYGIDNAGNQTSITDAAGNVTRFEYDHAGTLLRQFDAMSNATTFTYDGNGNQISQTTVVTVAPGVVRTNVTFTFYDGNGKPVAVTDALGNTTRTIYDALGKTSATVDALGYTNRFVYDDRGRLLSTVFADGSSNRVAYDAAGRRTNSTDRAGRSTFYEYDLLGRLISTTSPNGTHTRTVYDLAGRVIAQIDERSNRTIFDYDAAGRQTAVTNALGFATRSEFDAAGRKTADIDALGRTTRFDYDDLGRRIHTRFADGTSNTTVYDALGRIAVEVDQAGVSNAFGYDALGRLLSVTNAVGTSNQIVTVYAYNEAGNLIRQQDALGRVTRYEYDGLGRRVANVLPMLQRSSTLYNSVGNVAATTNFNGQAVAYEYDANHRLAIKRLPDGTSVEYGYTPTGRRARVVIFNAAHSVSNVWSFAYDARDRLVRRVDPDGRAIAYSYDEAGNRTKIRTGTAQFPLTLGEGALSTTNSTTRFTFDPLNRLETVTDADGGVARYTYDPANNVQFVALPNGTFRTNVYDALNRVTNIAHLGPSGVFSSFRYTLGATGQRLGVQENTGRTVQYAYDPLSRLTRESITDASAGNRTVDYALDTVGNRLARMDSVEGRTDYSYDDNDQLLTETLGGNTTRYTYDFNGNTLSRSNNVEQASYNWSVENRLVAAAVSSTNSSHALAYQYDDDGIRVAAFVDGDENRYLIDANRSFAQVVEEYAPNGAVRAAYTHGPHHLISQSRAGTRSWYHADGLGSTRSLTGQSGSPTDRYHFDAYGRTLAQNGPTENAYLYAGEQRDRNLGLDYLRARYLNFTAGMFYGRDPRDGASQQPISSHPYLYGSDNPINFIDPSGEFTLVDVAATVAIVGILYENVFHGPSRLSAGEAWPHSHGFWSAEHETKFRQFTRERIFPAQWDPKLGIHVT